MNGLRFVEVHGDNMEPTMRRRDYVLVAPTDRWMGEGYYLIAWPGPYGGEAIYGCSADGPNRAKPVRLHNHNKHYSDQFVTREEFKRVVTGYVAATCKVLDHDAIWRASRLAA